ncbi:sporulation histidine kinase inhibitor Sda [Paenibacillus sp. LHD-38]|nr:sporulation histidine kinase inhibitor Sda [Paenibacillus sp. LHD-38]MDQ8733261.1 sporulation histidine kinase inhibitor Sda [Paenibacillus sp. LHD-38]
MHTLSDEELLKIYYCAVDLNLEIDFLDILLTEIKRREVMEAGVVLPNVSENGLFCRMPLNFKKT